MFREVTTMEGEAKRGRGRPKGSTKNLEKRLRLNFVIEKPFAEHLMLIADLEHNGNLSELLRDLCIEELVRRRAIPALAKIL